MHLFPQRVLFAWTTRTSSLIGAARADSTDSAALRKADCVSLGFWAGLQSSGLVVGSNVQIIGSGGDVKTQSERLALLWGNQDRLIIGKQRERAKARVAAGSDT